MITLREYEARDKPVFLTLIVQFFNHHADCMNKERWIDLSRAETILEEWLEDHLLFACETTVSAKCDGAVELSECFHECAEQQRKRITVGLVRLREDHGTYWIEDIIVDEHWRDKGIGSEILNQIEHWVSSKGATSLFLDVVPSNLGALDFFLSNGYLYLNTIELRKDFVRTVSSEVLTLDAQGSKEKETPKVTEVIFLGRCFLVNGELKLSD